MVTYLIQRRLKHRTPAQAKYPNLQPPYKAVLKTNHLPKNIPAWLRSEFGSGKYRITSPTLRFNCVFVGEV